MVEAERLARRRRCCAGDRAGRRPTSSRPWFTDVVGDHLLSYGHGAIYAQKAFQLLDRLGWERADTVLPHLVPTIVYGTREDKLPYMRPFHAGARQLDLDARRGRRPTRLGGRRAARRRAARSDRTEARVAGGAPRCATAPGVDGVLDTVVDAVSERMLRYDADGEFDFADDFGWLDITHGITYANAAAGTRSARR